jgi:L,D-peptidoglycan transpeptidase YkuD (ErfK/YbiS/YcfS/YnhG family)
VESGLPVSKISKQDGWCTEPEDAGYNQQIRLPHSGEHEMLWRDDPLYDVIAVIGYNDAPVVVGRGSAIFLHIARPALSPTDGCVALPKPALIEVLRRCDTNTWMNIEV